MQRFYMLKQELIANTEICRTPLIIRPKLKKMAVRYQKTSDSKNDTKDTGQISTQLGSQPYYDAIACNSTLLWALKSTWITRNSDNRRSDKQGSTVFTFIIFPKRSSWKQYNGLVTFPSKFDAELRHNPCVKHRPPTWTPNFRHFCASLTELKISRHHQTNNSNRLASYKLIQSPPFLNWVSSCYKCTLYFRFGFQTSCSCHPNLDSRSKL